MSTDVTQIDGEHLTLAQVEQVAHRSARVALAPAAKEKLHAARAFVESIARSDEPVYGITTGFGEFKKVRIEPAQTARLQLNLVRSHAAGVGELLSAPEVRAIMLLRANTLAKGYSGIRVETVERLLDVLNAGLIPAIPAQGSVGASGDLAPLAHLALALIGEGDMVQDGRIVPGGEALRMAGLRPLTLEAKEGLALVNGTAPSAALGALTLFRALRVCTVADITGAMTLEATNGSRKAFDARIHRQRPHPGQMVAASNLTRLVADSPIIASHAHCPEVQDAYSLRCMPQVHGAARDAVAFVKSILSIELNAVTDNPLVFADDGETLSGGNFHGQPVALAADVLCLAMADVSSISERRIERLVNPQLNSTLPGCLVKNSGLHSGFMMAQVTAAALVSENKTLAAPASVDSITTSANQEDHVSMSMTAVRKAARMLDNVETVLAIEALCAAQALDFRLPLTPGAGTRAAYRAVRALIPHLDEDRPLYRDIEASRTLIRSGQLQSAVEDAIGALE